MRREDAIWIPRARSWILVDGLLHVRLELLQPDQVAADSGEAVADTLTRRCRPLRHSSCVTVKLGVTDVSGKVIHCGP